jgi:N-acetylneuraminic acid mutarotase
MFRPSKHPWAAAGVAATIIVAGVGVPSAANAAAPEVTVSGQIRDASGHGWPLYARVTVDNVGTAFTDPATGRYQLTVPDGADYTLNVTPLYPGYQPAQATVTANGTDAVRDFSVTIDASACAAPGYGEQLNGLRTSFDDQTTPDGWTVVNHTADGGWTFTDDGGRGNLTGGSDGFAIIDSDHLGVGRSQDTEMISPVIDFTGMTAPTIRFNSDWRGFSGSFGDLDLSVDGGTTWSNLMHNVASARGPALVQVPLPQAAGVATARLRWRYVGSFGWWWQVDNVFAGERSCQPVHGGLVLGQTNDANTQQPMSGVTVKSDESRGDSAVSAATPDDPVLGDGFYWMFSSLTGSHSFTASKGGFLSTTKNVTVATDWVTTANFNLGAGKIVVTPPSIAKTVKMDATATATITVKNTGAAPATVAVGERDDGFTTLLHQGSGAPQTLIRGTYSRHQSPAPGSAAPAPIAPQPAAAPWTDVANYPSVMMDNTAVAGGGKIYSLGGTPDGFGPVASSFVFDPALGSWSPIADLITPRQKAVAAFVSGRLYVVGGWGPDGDPVTSTEVYNPATNTWSAGPTAPTAFAAAGGATIGSKIYMVGGCDGNACGHQDVLVFDTEANTFTQLADYPLSMAWMSCGGVLGRVYCAGGTNDDGDTKQAYSLNPATNSWSRIADLPIDLWASGYVATSDALLISGGVTDNASSLTNQGFAYNPGTNAWTEIANSNNTVYRAGSACGFYKIGGSVGNFNAVNKAEVLPGFDQCGSAADVRWLSVTPSSFTIAPGATVKLAVAFDASSAITSQPGDYSAAITYSTDTPYVVAPTAVTMTVTPPNTWGKISGKVSGAGCSGTVSLAGATVQIDTWAAHYTLVTDADGNYGLWLDKRNNPLTVIAAKDGWAPQVKTAKIIAAQVLTVNWTLAPGRPC